MLQKVDNISLLKPGGGLVTYPNFFQLEPNQSPNCMDVIFGLGGTLSKRFGSTTLNSIILVSSAATGFSPDNSGTLSTGLNAFWKLNEVAGTRLDEFNGNNLTDVNTVSFGPGILGNAASFVQLDSEELIVSDNANLRAGNISFTLAAWFNLGSSLGANARITLVGKGTNNSQIEYALNVNDVPRVMFSAGSAGGFASVTANSFGTLSTSTWYLAIGWRDSANGIIGVQVNTSVNTASFLDAVTGGTAPFGMAGLQGIPDVTNPYFQGRIDEVGFWRKALTSQERTDLYNAGAANSYSSGASNSGFGSFDFGAGFSNGEPLRWLIVSAGTGIYASSNRGTSFVVIATDRRSNYQEFERSKSFLVAVSDTFNRVLYWAGSVGTFMLSLAPGSAPAAKHALDFQGFLLLMNDSGGRNRISYADNNTFTTDPWTNTFSIPTELDDEITASVILYKTAYIFTKFKLYRLSFVGGNPDFAYQLIKSWGAVPRTVKKATILNLGEVIFALGWDKKLRIFDGANDQVISTPIELDNKQSQVFMENINVNAIEKSFAVVDENEQVYKLWVAIMPSTQVTNCICFNLRNFAFYPYSNQSFQTAIMAESSNTRKLLTVSRNGFVHLVDTTNRDLVTAVNDYYDTPFLFRNNPATVSKNQKIDFYFSATSSGTLIYQDRSGFSNTFGPVKDTISFSNTGGLLQIFKSVDIPGTQNVYQGRLSSSSNTATPWQLNRIDYHGVSLGLGKAP